MDEPTTPLDEAAAPAEASRRFRPGTVVAGRYTVVRFVGEGGMGEVYEALDGELDERVALKTLRGEMAADPDVRASFKREIQLARKVTHPNVCRIFDLGSDGDVMFLTMEFLAGETLSARLERLDGERLPVAAALPLLRQIAAGLDAAHHAGVVHGDLKPGNVMLVGERAVITDFGLAQRPEEAIAARHGTPGYMAPEQTGRAGPTTAVDVYAFGVVMHRVITGAIPLAAGTPAGLEEPALDPALDPRWRAAMAACLRPRPDHRSARAGDVVRALERLPSRRLWLAGLATLAMGLAVGLWLHGRMPAPPRSLAVLGLENPSGRPELAWLSLGLPEILTAELAGGELRVLPTEATARLAAAAVPALRVDYYVAGQIVPLPGDRLRLELRLVDARSGETLAEIREEDAEPAELGRRAAVPLRAALGIAPPSAPPRPRLPRGREAARLYLEGMARLRTYEAKAAIPLLARAALAEPDFALAQVALADAHWFLGDEAEARTAVKRAMALADGETPETRQVIEARSWETAAEPDKAAEVYQGLRREHPDNPEYGFRLMTARWRAGHSDAAGQVLAELRALPPPVGDDPRLDVMELRLAVFAGDGERARPAAARLVEKSRAQGLGPLLFEGLAAQATFHWTDGRLVEAAAKVREAQALAGEMGDRQGSSSLAYVLGLILLDGGRVADAEQVFQAMTPDESEARTPAANRLDGLGRVALARGDGAAALASFVAELDSATQAEGRRVVTTRAKLGIGRARLALGETRAARAALDEALAVAEPQGWQGETAYLLTALAAVDEIEGAHQPAAERLERALVIWRARGALLEVARLEIALGRLALARGLPAEALERGQRARRTFQETRVADDELAAATLVAEALLALGRPAEARAALPGAPSTERPPLADAAARVRARIPPDPR